MSERQKMLRFQLIFSIQKAHTGVTGYYILYTHTQVYYITILFMCECIYYNILVIPSPTIQPALKYQEKYIRIASVYTIKLSKI